MKSKIEPAIWFPTVRTGTGTDIFTERLVEGLVTPHVSVPKDLRQVPAAYQKLQVQSYGKDQVSFYAFQQQHYAFVESKRFFSFLRPDNKVLLQQCL